mgnify:CR=1 FL=1
MIGFDFEGAAPLAAAGIAWDISGGIALARGLILDDDTLNRRAGSSWGSSPPAIRGLCEQRIDAKFGLTQLLIGFLLQLLSACGVTANPLLAIFLALLTLLAWAVYRLNFAYWVTLASLRHVSSDTSEETWRQHFLDIPEMTWRAAVAQLGLTFRQRKS